MLTKDTAICIRTLDYSETSQIVTFFARATGKISVIAKGSKRPKSAFDGPLEVFSYGKIVFSDSTREKLATLTEFESAGPGLTRLAGNLFTLNCASFAAELVNNLTDDYDPHPQLFDGFLQFLQNTNKIRDTLHACPEHSRRASRDTLALLILFQLALLKEVGLMPVLNACANCKNDFSAKWDEVYFSNSANGLVCRDCQSSFPDKIRLTETAANCVSNLKTIAGANEKTLNEIEKVLIYHFTEILGHLPKMAKYILKS